MFFIELFGALLTGMFVGGAATYRYLHMQYRVLPRTNNSSLTLNNLRIAISIKGSQEIQTSFEALLFKYGAQVFTIDHNLDQDVSQYDIIMLSETHTKNYFAWMHGRFYSRDKIQVGSFSEETGDGHRYDFVDLFPTVIKELCDAYQRASELPIKSEIQSCLQETCSHESQQQIIRGLAPSTLNPPISSKAGLKLYSNIFITTTSSN